MSCILKVLSYKSYKDLQLQQQKAKSSLEIVFFLLFFHSLLKLYPAKAGDTDELKASCSVNPLSFWGFDFDSI